MSMEICGGGGEFRFLVDKVTDVGCRGKPGVVSK